MNTTKIVHRQHQAPDTLCTLQAHCSSQEVRTGHTGHKACLLLPHSALTEYEHKTPLLTTSQRASHRFTRFWTCVPHPTTTQAH